MSRPVLSIPWSLACAAALLVGCGEGTIGVPPDPGMPDGGPGAADGGVGPDAGPTVQEVPETVATLTMSSTCAALGADERPLATSPEGHLWIADTSTVTAEIHVRDAWNPSQEARFALAFDRITQLQAWSATTASVLADDALWFVTGDERVSVSVPATLDGNVSLCGDAREAGFVLADGVLLQRVDDAWLEWTGLDSALDARAAILARDGECWGAEDRVWLTSGDLEVWELRPAAVTRPGDFAASARAAVREAQLLVMSEGELHVGPTDWQRWSFAHGTGTLLAAAGAYAWMLAGDALLRFDGTSFRRVDVPLGAAPTALFPHASGGLWLEAGDQVCHLTPEEMIRVQDVRNGQVRRGADLSLRARVTDPTRDLVATLDGEALAPAFVADDWLTFSASVSIGWHDLQLTALDGRARRALTLKRQPDVERSFATDIQPIYANHCAAANCHVTDSPAGAPDLSTYEDWVARATAIQNRVVRQENMPPPSARGADWDREEVDVINEWLSGGLKP